MVNYLPLLLIGALAALLGLHGLWFILLPSWLWKGTGPGMRERRRIYLEWIAATPSFLGEHAKLPALIRILQTHVEQGRHEEVVALCRRMLAAGLTPGLESTTRHHLADSLEALGDPDAAEERRLARTCLKWSDEDVLTCISRGKLLNKENRHEEAYAAFERGLEMAETSPSAVRVELLAHMSLSAFNAGRVEESSRLSEQAIAEGAEGTQLRLAHRMAGMTLAALGRLEEAEEHKRKALAVAKALGDVRDMADAMADLAEIQRKRGRLAEALRACDEVIATYPADCRHALSVRYEILKVQGRFDEALAALEKARRTPGLVIPHYQRRMQAVQAMASAWTLLDAGRPDEAEEWVREAEPVLSADPKLSLWVVTARARLAAMRGDFDGYRLACEQAEEQMKTATEDPTNLKGALVSLGKAAIAIGDFSRGLDYWEQYRAQNLNPVERPTVLFHLGLCLKGLERPDAARAAFREAADSGLDTLHAREAGAQLRTLARA